MKATTEDLKEAIATTWETILKLDREGRFEEAKLMQVVKDNLVKTLDKEYS